MSENFTWQTVKKIIHDNIPMTIGILLLAAAAVICSLIPPQIIKRIIDTQLAIGRTDKLLILSVSYLGILTLVAVCDFLKAALLTAFGQKIRRQARMGMMKKLERLPLPYFSEHSTGEVAGHIINDVDAVDTLFSDGIINMAVDCFKIVGIVIAICLFSIPLGVSVLLAVPVVYFLTRMFQRKMLQAQVENLGELGNVNSHITESVKNIHMVQSLGKEEYMEKRYRKLLRRNYKTLKKVNFYDSCYSPIIQIIRAAAVTLIVIVTVAVGEKTVFGITIGMLAAAIEYISNLFVPIENLGMEIQSLQKGISGIRRMNTFNLLEEERKREETTAAKNIADDFSGIEFQKVSFYYEETKPVLQDFSIKILPEEQIVFVGRTGVGKSTLFKLLLGLLEPVQGRILINGIDVCTISHSVKRKLFGYVEQRFQFVEGDINRQISLGEESVTQERVTEVMKLVGLHEYIQNLPQGYHTKVDTQKHFSEGQKQLLGIARAMVCNPPILLFDEMTANLDSKTEEKVIAVIKEVCKNKTMLTISHRLSGVLENSKIRELT